MIKPKHAVILVSAKLRARPGRSAVIILVSSILFGLALAGLIIINATLSSAQRFSDATFGGRQYVQAEYIRSTDELRANRAIQQRAQIIYEADIAQKKIEAKKLGIDFDPRTVVEPLERFPGENNDASLNLTAPSAKQAITEYETQNPGITIQTLKKLAKSYSSTSVREVSGLYVNDGSMSLMKDGKEVFSSVQAPVDTSYDFIAQSSMRLIDESVMRPFVNSSIKTDSNEIAVVLPYSAAETVLNIDTLNKDASTAQRLERLEYLQKNAVGKQFSVCYRNTASKQQIDQAANSAGPAEEDSGNGISYGLPGADSCGAAKVVQDRRSTEARASDKKQAAFNQVFGIQSSPLQRKLDFRVVGLVPDDLWTATSSRSDPIETARLVLGPSLLGHVTITTQTYKALPDSLKSILKVGQAQAALNTDTYLVEFRNASDAYKFIHEQSCDRIQGALCGTNKNPFRLSAFGSSGVTLIDFKNITTRVSSYFIGAIIIVAVLVMGGTFGRIIADERREIAVFRAVGATRLDITIVYVAYALSLALFSAIVTLVIGYLAAILVHSALAGDLTAAMRLTYGVLDEAVKMKLYTIDSSIPIIMIAVGVTSLTSILVPLRGGINRDIVQDLKDE